MVIRYGAVGARFAPAPNVPHLSIIAEAIPEFNIEDISKTPYIDERQGNIFEHVEEREPEDESSDDDSILMLLDKILK